MWRIISCVLVLTVAAGGAEPKKEAADDAKRQKEAAKKAAPKKKGTDNKLFIADVYKGEPNIEAALDLTPEQLAKLTAIMQDTMLSLKHEGLRQQSINPDLRESQKKVAKERYDRVQDQARGEYDRRAHAVLTPEQQLIINRINSGLERSLDNIRRRYGDRARGQSERRQKTINAERDDRVQEAIDDRIDRVLTDEQKGKVGREPKNK